MANDKIRLLLIEDDEDDCLLIREILAETPFSRFDVEWVMDYESGVEAVSRHQHDVYLLDLGLGERSGLDLLRQIKPDLCIAPVIVLTGRGEYEFDFDAMKIGAADYLHKDQISPTLLERSIRYSIERKHAEMELRRHRDNLEGLVKERTVELEQTNRMLHQEIAEHMSDKQALRRGEEHYRSLFENMLDGFSYCRMVFEGDEAVDFEFISVNPAFELHTGLKDVIGRKVSEVIPGIRQAHPEMFEIYGRVALTGKAERFEIYLEMLAVWLLVSVYSTRKGYFVAVLENITEHKQAEEVLARYALLAENSRDIILFVRREDAGIIEANAAAVNAYGYSHQDLLALTVHDLKANETPMLITNQLVDADARGILIETVHRRKDGSTFPVEVSARGVDIGGMRTVISVVRDITERKRAEDEREGLIVQLQDALANIKTLSGLLPICSHCKKIRNDEGYWQQIESYIHEHSGTEFSHGICPDCLKEHYSELLGKKLKHESGT